MLGRRETRQPQRIQVQGKGSDRYDEIPRVSEPAGTGHLVRVVDGDSWTLRVEPSDIVNKVFGEDAAGLFCGALVLADRLTSVACLFQILYAAEGIAHGRVRRDEHALVVFGWGTIRELAKVLPPLRGHLLKRSLITTWPAPLQTLEDEWQSGVGKKLRDQIAFHVDPELMRKGLARRESEPLFLGSSDLGSDSWFVQGHLALFEGMAVSPDDIRDRVVALAKNFGIAATLQELFKTCLESKGVRLTDRPSSQP